MDILRELSDEEIYFICEKFEKKLPYTLKDLYYIKSTLKYREASSYYKNLSDKLLPKIYTHRYGKKENCTIFGINGKNDPTVWYFSFDESLKEIKECLESKYIMWGTKFMFETIHVEQIEPILLIANRIQLKMNFEGNASCLALSVEDALKFQIEIPQGTSLRELQVDDTEFCTNSWFEKTQEKLKWMKSLIEVHIGYALIDNETKEILSFAIINNHYAISGLMTVEHARRKSYAEIIIKNLSKELAKRNLIPFAYINDQSIKSLNLFKKLGFKTICGVARIFMESQ